MIKQTVKNYKIINLFINNYMYLDTCTDDII